MKRKLGLTLIELLAVIAIIAILFILLVPQITKAVDKARISGVQTDLHSYEVGMRSYFLEHFGEAKTVVDLNKYLDKSLQFEEKDGKFYSKSELNPYDVKYELTSDWQTFMQVNSYTDEKEARIHAVRVYEEGNEVKSKYIGFDDDKLKSEVDTQNPVIMIEPNGGEDVEVVFVEAKDNNEIYKVYYAWSKESELTEAQWQSMQNNTELSTVFLGRGEYYLHIKAIDMDMNAATLSSNKFTLGDDQLPIIVVTKNGSDEEKVQHSTTISATDNKGVSKIEYAWSDSNEKDVITTPWTTISNNTEVKTPADQGNFYLHIKVTDISGNIGYFISNPFNTGDKTPPEVSLSVNGSTVEKDEHTTVVITTDNDEISSVKYVWSKETTKPSTGWKNTSNGSTLTTPTINGDLYLYIQATDRSGNTTQYKSNAFKTGDRINPVISLSPNGNSTLATTHTTTITATDNKGIKKVEYVWSEAEEAPTTGWQTTNSGSSVTSNQEDGNVYLYVKAEDVFGNITQFKSEVFVQSPYRYTVNENGTTINRYVGAKTDIVIPSVLGGKNVTDIGYDAFHSKELVSVVIPNTVKFIGAGAFQNNKITSLTLSNSIETIAYAAFYRNNLTEVKLPSSLKTMSEIAFHENTQLKNVQNCTSLNVDYAFNSSPIITKEGC